MKSNQKMSLLVWLRKGKATKNGTAPVYVRVTIDGLDEEISLGEKIHPDNWDSDLKVARGTDALSKVANLCIQDARECLEMYFKLLARTYEKVTPLMVKRAFNKVALEDVEKPDSPKMFNPAVKTLIPAFDRYIATFASRVEKNLASDGTLRHWRSTRKKVQEFLRAHYKQDDIELSAIKYAFSQSLYEYLTIEVPEPLSEATAKKHIKKLKQILELCSTNEWIAKNPIKGFKCGGDDTDILPLELVEVETLYCKQLPIERLAEIRDAFIFQCFTGFAYQDVYDLTPENIIRVGKNGERWLIKNRGKTGVTEMVPILPIVEEIIARYAHHAQCRIKNCLLPVNSNVRYNGYLKELAVICGINRELNTHLARHTFADIMLNNGVPLEDVGKMLGHKSIRTTQRYAKVRKERISKNMAKLKSVLFTADGKLRKAS